MTKEQEEIARKVEDDCWKFGEKVNKLIEETTKGYSRQIFKVAMLDIMVNTLIQKFKDVDSDKYSKVKDIMLTMLENSKVTWITKEKKVKKQAKEFGIKQVEKI